MPKQLQRPIETWVTSAQFEAEAFGLSAHDRFAVLGSPSHSLWGYAHFRAAQLGALCVGLSVSDIAAWSVSALQKCNAVAPTVLYGVPELVATFVRQLQRHAQPALNVRMVLLGGGPISTSFPMSLMRSTFPNTSVWSFYGTAETSFIGYRRLDLADSDSALAGDEGRSQGSQCVHSNHSGSKPGEASPFVLFPSVELDIRAEYDRGAIGEIWVRSPMTITPEKWMGTSDLGRWADGGRGRFYLLGRAARQLVLKGNKRVVEPIEQALMQRLGLAHVALLANSAGRVCCLVAGCSGEDGAGGSALVHGPSLEQVNEACRDHDSGFPGVRRVITLAASEWPNTPAGKTNFLALREILEGANT